MPSSPPTSLLLYHSPLPCPSSFAHSLPLYLHGEVLACVHLWHTCHAAYMPCHRCHRCHATRLVATKQQSFLCCFSTYMPWCIIHTLPCSQGTATARTHTHTHTHSEGLTERDAGGGGGTRGHLQKMRPQERQWWRRLKRSKAFLHLKHCDTPCMLMRQTREADHLRQRWDTPCMHTLSPPVCTPSRLPA